MYIIGDTTSGTITGTMDELNKLMLHALRGMKPPYALVVQADKEKKRGTSTLGRLIQFCGNQHNEDWQWDEKALALMPPVDLFNLYTNWVKK